MWGTFSKNLIRNSVPRRKCIRRKLCDMNGDLEINRIVWVDLEMTGLDIEKDTILEIACIVTDSNLNIVAESPNMVIQTPEATLKCMDEWCIQQHGKTGLTEAAIKSDLTLQQAESNMMDFISAHVMKTHSPLAGNSVYMDRLFLRKFMPTFNEFLHYRIIDTSSVKELCRRWNNELYKKAPKKQFSHRALDDIRESIEELRYYRKNFFNIKC